MKQTHLTGVLKVALTLTLLLTLVLTGCTNPETLTEFTVTYDKNGATSGTVPVGEITYKTTDLIPVQANTNSLLKIGYVFIGWNSKSDGTGTDYDIDSTFRVKTDNITLFAKWFDDGSSVVVPVTQDDNSNLLFGNPDNATTDINNPNHYLMVKQQYVLSYNNSKLICNWTSWHLNSSDIGTTDRRNDFRADATLPTPWYHVNQDDYKYSTYAFDRGHMCNSSARTSSIVNNSATFLMVNMIPQCGDNNQKTWNQLETYTDGLISQGKEVYIISGPLGQGGNSGNGIINSIPVNNGLNNITVPAETWKIILIIDNGNGDLARVSASTRVIAVRMPNNTTCSSKTWQQYRISVDSLEAATGYDFLKNLPDAVENVIEATADTL